MYSVVEYLDIKVFGYNNITIVSSETCKIMYVHSLAKILATIIVHVPRLVTFSSTCFTHGSYVLLPEFSIADTRTCKSMELSCIA